MSSRFVGAVEGAVSEFVAVWQERDEAANWEQRHDEELIREELRPLVFEEVRKQVRLRLRRMGRLLAVGGVGLTASGCSRMLAARCGGEAEDMHPLLTRAASLQ